MAFVPSTAPGALVARVGSAATTASGPLAPAAGESAAFVPNRRAVLLAPSTAPARSVRSGAIGVTAVVADARAPSGQKVYAPQANVAVVTGASSSIGLHAAKELSQRGDYHVVLAVRNPAKAAEAARAVGMKDDTFTILPLDLADLSSVRKFIKEFQTAGFGRLHALVCNAATWHPRDKAPRFTVDGFDETVQVNHLGHFLLANLLLPQLRLSKGRMVFLATQTHNPDTLPGKIPPQADLGELDGMKSGFTQLPGTIDGKSFEPTKAYKDSKVCNILTMNEMNRRFGGQGVTFSAIFPGCIAASELFREKRGWFRWFFPLFQRYVTKQFVPVEEAGRRVALVASDGKFADSGTYWQWRGSYLEGMDKTAPVPIDPTEREADKAEALWNLSAELVGLKA